MPIDRKSKSNLIRGQVKARKREHDASLPDSERMKARRKADFYGIVRKRLEGVADYAAEARYEREFGTKRTRS